MNRKIIVATFIIAGSGIANAWTKNKPITGVIVGSYIFILMLSIMDMFGGPFAQLSGALAMLAVTYVLLTQVPWNTIIKTVTGKKG